MRYFKEYLTTMFEQYPRSIKKDVPMEFALNHLVGSFAEQVGIKEKTARFINSIIAANTVAI